MYCQPATVELSTAVATVTRGCQVHAVWLV